MNLLPDWRWLIRKAWSIRLLVLAGLFSGAEIILPLYMDAMPRHIFAILSMLAAVGGIVARITAQPKMERRSKPRRVPDIERADFSD